MAGNEETSVDRPAPTLELGPAARWIAPALFGFIMIVLALATGLEALAVGARPPLGSLLAAPGADPGFTARELAAHLETRAAIQLLLGAIVASVLGAAYMVWRTARVARGPVIVLVGMAVCGGLACTLCLGSAERSTSFLRQLVFLAESRSAPFRESGLATLTLLPKTCGDLVCNLIGLGVACTVILPARMSAEDLARSLRRLRVILYGGAGMLVFGILVLRSSYAWLLTFVVAAEDPAVAALVRSGTYLSGAFYSLMLAAVYVPAAAVLAHHAGRLGEVAAGDATRQEAVRGWLKERDLVVSWQGQLARLGALMAPVLSGTVVQLVGAAGG